MIDGYFSELDFTHRNTTFAINKCAMFEIRMCNSHNIAIMLITDEQAKELADFIYERLNGLVEYETIVGTKKGQRQMSSKELKLTNAHVNLECDKVLDSYRFQLTDLVGIGVIYLGRDQAHLLKLWLEEHLK